MIILKSEHRKIILELEKKIKDLESSNKELKKSNVELEQCFNKKLPTENDILTNNNIYLIYTTRYRRFFRSKNNRYSISTNEKCHELPNLFKTFCERKGHDGTHYVTLDLLMEYINKYNYGILESKDEGESQ